ncbi:MAG: heme biosynthesis protein HemY [Parvibaculaceae bacterium]
MTRLMVRLALLAAAAAGFAWLADRPGTVVIRWMNREIETSVLAASAALIFAVLALWFSLGLLRRLIGSPSALGDYLRFRRTRRGYESLSKGIIAAGAGDAQGAQRFAALAQRNLNDEPLVRLLEAQAAQLKGDRAAVRRAFESMLKSPETEPLGLRGLYAEARQAGNLDKARSLAERALKINPQLGWASSAMLAIQSQGRDWDAALATLETQRRAGHLNPDKAKRMRAVLLAAKALAAETDNRDQALVFAREAHKLDPALAPAACVAVRVLASQNALRRAYKIALRTWALTPHPDLAEAYAFARIGDKPADRLERVRRLAGAKPDNTEGAYALGRAAAEARAWPEARAVLAKLSESDPQARVCALMAEIEEGEGDRGRAREWLARAVRARRDPMWMIDGSALPAWSPVSPVTGEIAFAEWKVPFDMLPAEARRDEPSAAEAAAPPPPAIEQAPPAPPPPPEPAKPVIADAALPPPKPPKPVMVEPMRPPDDPGLPEEEPRGNPALAGG